jgi:hypothetical protein
VKSRREWKINNRAVRALPYSRLFSITVDFREQPEPTIGAITEVIMAFLHGVLPGPRKGLSGTISSGTRIVIGENGKVRHYPSMTYAGMTDLPLYKAVSLINHLAYCLVAMSSAGGREADALVIIGGQRFRVTIPAERK